MDTALCPDGLDYDSLCFYVEQSTYPCNESREFSLGRASAFVDICHSAGVLTFEQAARLRARIVQLRFGADD